jgi:hypothetical protein
MQYKAAVKPKAGCVLAGRTGGGHGGVMGVFSPQALRIWPDLPRWT